MADIILWPNAAPVYGFLSTINAMQVEGTRQQGKRVLDCGAGGRIPPLALFHQQSYDAWGIDISAEQIERARQLCEEQELQVHLHQGDMRRMPFADETFDYGYEHYSMCHLSKQDTARAVGEMRRVLKQGGLCFLGVMSMDCWPKSLWGEEREPGEFWGEEHGELTLHSMFIDEETKLLVSSWEVIAKEKQTLFLGERARETSMDTWMEMLPQAPGQYTRAAWEARYDQREHEFQYAHVYYYLRKT